MLTESPPTCSIQASLDVLGDRWTILILRDAFRGVRRFDEFRRDLDIARPVLTDRLKRLVEHGVLRQWLGVVAEFGLVLVDHIQCDLQHAVRTHRTVSNRRDHGWQ